MSDYPFDNPLWINNRLVCGYCHVACERVTGTGIYPNRSDLWRKRFFQCPQCKAYTGTRNDGTPVGTVANEATRAARMKAHSLFDQLWKGKRKSRSEAYEELADHMDLFLSECHIALFNEAECQKVIDFAESKIPSPFSPVEEE